MSYNSDPKVQTLAQALAMSPDLRQNAVSTFFERQSAQYNALKNFTSVYDPKTMRANGGARSVFVEITDLSKGGASTVVHNTIGTPAGPGAIGDEELTGRTSNARMGTSKTIVDWIRDAFELTEDEVEMLTAGRSIEEVSVALLSEKMGLVKQNHQLKRLIRDANGNIQRPNGRASVNDLLPTDTLSLDLTSSARAVLSNMGAKSLMMDMSKSGCPINKYLVFASEQSLLPIRNDSSFSTAIQRADVRGPNNSAFTGELMDWQGYPFYEFPETDMDWDDFKGGPLSAKAELGVAFSTASTAGNCKLVVNAANIQSRYFQFFDGYPFQFVRAAVETPPDYSANEYYAWIVNPDGSRGFVAYQGGFNGNQIVVTKVLSKNGAGTSTKGATTVGELAVNTTASPDEWTGGNSTLPVLSPNGAWIYTDSFVAGAMIFQVNAKGVPYTRSFILGSMAGHFAHGRVKLTAIKQDRDFDFVFGRGFKMIFGTSVCVNTQNKPRNYILIEHATEYPGYPLPSKI